MTRPNACQYITVDPATFRVTYHLGATAYRHAHAALHAHNAMWAHTVPCHKHGVWDSMVSDACYTLGDFQRFATAQQAHAECKRLAAMCNEILPAVWAAQGVANA